MTNEPAPLVPPMPKYRDDPAATGMDVDWRYTHNLEKWGRQCAEIAQAQARRADEAERTLWQTVDERDEAYATLAQRDREVLALTKALEMIAADMNCADEEAGVGTCRQRFPSKPHCWCPPCVAIDVLRDTAQAGAEAERRTREDERERIKAIITETRDSWEAAILGTGGEDK